MELLSPAGDHESAIGALNAGADAVYLGAQFFSARASAKNLSVDELKDVISYAHLLGKKIYLTTNILMYNSELIELFEIMDPLYEAGLDACIIQDLGVLRAFRSRYSELGLHASTQMAVMTAYGSRWLMDRGVSRVVPARELSLSEIKEIKKTGVEVECFIHGAMCYAYSGKCLMSSLAGGRSGNRGRCAGPCRQKYRTDNTDYAYYLSMKDMCSATYIDKLIDAGIDSFKIEGRLKSPEYSAGVTAVYRRIIDEYANTGALRITEDDRKCLDELYIRSDRQEGYYFKHNGREMVSVKSPAYVKTPDILKENIRKKYLTGKKKVLLDGTLKVKCGEELELSLSTLTEDRAGENSGTALLESEKTVTVRGGIVQHAAGTPVSDEMLSDKIKMTGDTAFEIERLSIDNDGKSFVPVSVLKKIRRQALDELTDAVVMTRAGKVCSDAMIYGQGTVKADRKADGRKAENGREFIAAVRTKDQLYAVLKSSLTNGVIIRDFALLSDPSFTDSELKQIAGESDKKLYFALPEIIRQKAAEKIKRKTEELHASGLFAGVYCDGVDALAIASEYYDRSQIRGDIHLYAYNDIAASVIAENCGGYTAGVELNSKKLMHLSATGSPEFILYGYLPLMYSANCIYKTVDKCDKNSGICIIKDEKGHSFPMVPVHEFCYNILFNCVPVSLHNAWAKIKDGSIAQNYRLEFSVEDKAGTSEILSMFEALVSGERIDADSFFGREGFTAGHFSRGAD
ncbi:MAG: U32 family peptidase [Lachnospiraceae bacterium]|nr:U32 family peptidase [Lachnospiraceae bacterium]